MLKEISRVSIGLAGILSIATFATARFVPDATSATNCDSNSCNMTFQVNVQEALSVSITAPADAQDWASGTPIYDNATDTWSTNFLRNTVRLSVTSNNAGGFTASMYTSNANLTNTSRSTEQLGSLDNSIAKSDFPVNHWGYSLNTTGDTAENPTYNNRVYNESEEGNNSSQYHPVPASSASPHTVLTGTGHEEQDIYFGAKADLSQASGTYAGTVVISVVTGEIDNNNGTDAPSTPTDPATPITSGANPSYNSTANRTVYTTTSGNTTTTQVSDGDNRSTYANAAGVSESYVSSVSNSSPLAVGLATAAAVAAVSGGVFFVLAKRKKDDDEEE